MTEQIIVLVITVAFAVAGFFITRWIQNIEDNNAAVSEKVDSMEQIFREVVSKVNTMEKSMVTREQFTLYIQKQQGINAREKERITKLEKSASDTKKIGHIRGVN